MTPIECQALYFRADNSLFRRVSNWPKITDEEMEFFLHRYERHPFFEYQTLPVLQDPWRAENNVGGNTYAWIVNQYIGYDEKGVHWMRPKLIEGLSSQTDDLKLWKLEQLLHAKCRHPDYDYAFNEGKNIDHYDPRIPGIDLASGADNEGWHPNFAYGEEGLHVGMDDEYTDYYRRRKDWQVPESERTQPSSEEFTKLLHATSEHPYFEYKESKVDLTTVDDWQDLPLRILVLRLDESINLNTEIAWKYNTFRGDRGIVLSGNMLTGHFYRPRFEVIE